MPIGFKSDFHRISIECPTLVKGQVVIIIKNIRFFKNIRFLKILKALKIYINISN